jgi:hypothetical protein
MTDTSLTPQRFFAEKFGIAKEAGTYPRGVLGKPRTMGLFILNISLVSRLAWKMGS